MGEGEFLCMWLVEISGVFKIKSKTKSTQQRNLESLLCSPRKFQRDEMQQGTCSACVKYRSYKTIFWKSLVLRDLHAECGYHSQRETRAWPWRREEGCVWGREPAQCQIGTRLNIKVFGFPILNFFYNSWETQNIIHCGFLDGVLCYEHCWCLLGHLLRNLWGTLGRKVIHLLDKYVTFSFQLVSGEKLTYQALLAFYLSVPKSLLEK